MIMGRRREILRILVKADGPVFAADITAQTSADVHHSNIHSTLMLMCGRGWAIRLPKQGTHYRRYQVTALGKIALFFSDAEHDYWRGQTYDATRL
jgi:hypothetical protein